MITAEIKDQMLIKLIEGGFGDQIIGPKTFDFSYDQVQVILKQFKKRGFINSFDFSGLRYRVQVEADAHDFIGRGGFKFEEDAFRNHFTKLELELEKLEGEIPQDRFSNIMTLIGTVSSAISAYASLANK